MAPRKSDVSEEEAWEWVQRHRRGFSFRKIGKDSGRDPRYVAKVVRRLERATALREAEGARAIVGADALKGHHADMEQAARILLGVLMPPSLIGSLVPSTPDPDIEDVVIEKLTLALGHYDRYIPPGPLDKHITSLRAKAALEDLKEHLSEHSQSWAVVQELKTAHYDYYDAWHETLRSYSGDIEKVVQDIRSQSNTRPARRTPPALLEVVAYLEDIEKLFAQLGSLLNPVQLRPILLATRCRHCPLP